MKNDCTGHERHIKLETLSSGRQVKFTPELDFEYTIRLENGKLIFWGKPKEHKE